MALLYSVALLYNAKFLMVVKSGEFDKWLSIHQNFLYQNFALRKFLALH